MGGSWLISPPSVSNLFQEIPDKNFEFYVFKSVQFHCHPFKDAFEEYPLLTHFSRKLFSHVTDLCTFVNIKFHRIYTETDSDLPSYPNDFQVAKYSIFEKVKLLFKITTTAAVMSP